MTFLRLLACLLLASTAARAATYSLTLAGEWRFLKGGPRLTAHPGPLPEIRFTDTIELPGTTDTRRKGDPDDQRATNSFSQPYRHEGVCWYQRGITIPDEWRGKRVSLFLELSKSTRAWLDGRPLGTQAVFCTPQEYELGHDITPGLHTLTIAVDNKHLPPTGTDAHQFSGNTQGNWNGILGKIELRMTDPAWLDDVQIHPDAANRRITVKVRVKGSSTGTLTLTASGEGIPPDTKASAGVVGSTADLQLPLGPDAALWDEFHPVLHRLKVHFKAANHEDERQLTFGLRNFLAHGRQFTVNGRATFLRGRHDACVFPLTGHPPLDVEGWLAYFRTCRDYGLNHVRFHTWTPPDAAFTAADQLGFYLQAELPFWGTFDQQAKAAWEPEARRILSRFANHPSFVMMSMGNEHWADADVLASLVADLHAHDPRVLLVRGTNAFSWISQPGKGDDFYISGDIKPDPNGPQHKLRGANWGGVPAGHIQTGPANTLTDYSAAIAKATYPVITHEMGQYTVYPDFREISKYTGVSKPTNLESFRKLLEASGMAGQNAAFAKSSGALAALCYREEIEACLRTPEFGGFQLLDLQDFPGQGTALVGILDSFMDSKGIITPDQWRRFCAPEVLLARFPKYVWTAGETFTAAVQLAHYGEHDLPRAALAWKLVDEKGNTLLSGNLPDIDLLRGALRQIGNLSIPLTGITAPARLDLELTLPASHVTTRYPLWVYPPEVATEATPNVTLARTFDAATRKALADGGRVLLICDGTKPLARTVGGGFANDFWNFQFFHNQPGTLGLLCDPASPALAAFPTDFHSNWQWSALAINAQPLVLDAFTPPADRPIVQVIDNYARCNKLGLVFEMKVGPGRLLVCATDTIRLGTAHPEARQLQASLLAYASSDRFAPKTAVTPAALIDLFRTTIPMTGAVATASSFEENWQDFSPKHLIGGNEARAWHADPKSTGDSWCQVEFPAPVDLSACEILWKDAARRCLVQSSTDGTTWQNLRDETKPAQASRQFLDLQVKGAKFIRIVIKPAPGNRPAAISELRFLPAAESPDGA